MSRLRDPRLWIVIATAVVMGLLFQVFLLNERDRTARDFFATSQTEHSWMASSLMLEHIRLGSAFRQFMATGDSDAREGMMERFEIFLSRFDALNDYVMRQFEGIDSVEFDEDPLPGEKVDRLGRALQVLRNESPDKLAAIEAGLIVTDVDDRANADLVQRQMDDLGELLVVYEIEAFRRTRSLAVLRRASEEDIADRLDFAIRALFAMSLLLALIHIAHRAFKFRHAVALKQSKLRLAVKARETERLNRELDRRSSLDDVSGLMNRRGFVAALDKLLAESDEQHGLCVIDLDHFKVVNDTCGHDVGDRLICDVAQRLRAGARASDLLGRFGADEFVIVLHGCSEEAFHGRAQDLGDMLQTHRFDVDGRRFDVASSIGAVHFDASSSSRNELLAKADAARYVAKRTGGARVHFHGEADDLLTSRRQELEWIEKIQTALREDGFMLYCQPIRSLVGEHGSVPYGHEILLRMIADDGTVLSPVRFLPIAERFSMATQIDRWVVSKVFDLLRDRREDWTNIGTINVNLSGRTIGDDDFLDFLKTLTAQLPVPPSNVCFELTESALVDERAAGFLGCLRELGFRLALDDFGSGFSSFGYLESLPVDSIKIDGQFVRDVDTNPVHQEFVRAISAVGKAMGKDVVAEFVSNDASIEVLRDIGVGYVQGYHTGVPVPVSSIGAASDGDPAEESVRLTG